MAQYLDLQGLQRYSENLKVYIYENAVESKYGEKEVIKEYALITDPTQVISIADYEALSDEDKALYQAVTEKKDVTIKQAIEDAIDTSELTIDPAAAVTPGYLKTYSFKQNNVEIGKIDIPKDFLVKNAKVVEFTKVVDETTGTVEYFKDGVKIDALPSGVTDDKLGKYVEFVINAKESELPESESYIYIYVKDMVDLTDIEERLDNLETAVGSHEVGGENVLYPVTDRIKTEAKDADYTVDDTGAQTESIGEALTRFEEDLTYVGTVETLPTDPKKGDLVNVVPAATASPDAPKGWKFWDGSAWQNLSDASLADRVAILEALHDTKVDETGETVFKTVEEEIIEKAKDGDYKEVNDGYQLIAEPHTKITAAEYEALSPEDKALYEEVKKMETLAEVIEELEEASSKTNGAMVFKGIVETLPTTDLLPGDTYLVGKDADGYQLATYRDGAFVTGVTIDAKYFDAKAGTGYKLAENDVTIKDYIDSRIFVGTQAEVDAAKAAKEIDDTTFVVVVDEDAEKLEPITNDEIDDIFKNIFA